MEIIDLYEYEPLINIWKIRLNLIRTEWNGWLYRLSGGGNKLLWRKLSTYKYVLNRIKFNLRQNEEFLLKVYK